MANVDNPIGFYPVNMPYGNARVRRYRVDTANATSLFIGDPAYLDTTGCVIRATAGAGNYLVGFITGLYDSAGAPAGYLVSQTAGYALVADDPNQQFIGQEDGDTSDLSTANVGQGADVIIASGSTFNQRSGAEVDSSSVTTSTNAQLRIIEMAPSIDNAAGDYCKWIVKINYHQLNSGALGTAI